MKKLIILAAAILGLPACDDHVARTTGMPNIVAVGPTRVVAPTLDNVLAPITTEGEQVRLVNLATGVGLLKI